MGNGTDLSEEQHAELEKVFEKTCEEANVLIREQLDLSRAALRKAIEISEQYGVPFSGSPSFLRNGYIPQSLQSKFGDLDNDIIADISGVWSEYGYDAGWVHSAVC